MEAKEIKELVYKYCNSQYDHIANEPQFDCKMVDFNEVDLYEMIEVIINTAHNNAMDLAAKSAKMVYHDGHTKKNHSTSHYQSGADNIQVDTESITKLKIK